MVLTLPIVHRLVPLLSHQLTLLHPADAASLLQTTLIILLNTTAVDALMMVVVGVCRQAEAHAVHPEEEDAGGPLRDHRQTTTVVALVPCKVKMASNRLPVPIRDIKTHGTSNPEEPPARVVPVLRRTQMPFLSTRPLTGQDSRRDLINRLP